MRQASCVAWLERLDRLLDSDVSLVQIRAKQLDLHQLEDLVCACLELNSKRRKSILLNGPEELVTRDALDGIHLTSEKLLQANERPLARNYLVGASCHNQEELKHAQDIGCDFACLSPVKPTKSYHSDEVLGLKKFAHWVSHCNIPVYGLGGLAWGDLDEILNAGGQGVAGISAFW